MNGRSATPSPSVAPRRWLVPPTLWLAAAALVAIVGARLTEVFSIPWPRCGLRTLTGIPCPLCGATRSLVAWSHGDVAAAFALNPLVSAAVLGAGIWLCLEGSGLWRRAGWSHGFGTYFQGRSWRVLAVTLVVANWFYLLLTLPP
jgi:hypothetical protein